MSKNVEKPAPCSRVTDVKIGTHSACRVMGCRIHTITLHTSKFPFCTLFITENKKIHTSCYMNAIIFLLKIVTWCLHLSWTIIAGSWPTVQRTLLEGRGHLWKPVSLSGNWAKKRKKESKEKKKISSSSRSCNSLRIFFFLKKLKYQVGQNVYL